MTPAERTQLRISIELARWVTSAVVGMCSAFWIMVLSVLLSPAILDATARYLLGLFAVWSTLCAILWYTLVAQYWTLESRPPR